MATASSRNGVGFQFRLRNWTLTPFLEDSLRRATPRPRAKQLACALLRLKHVSRARNVRPARSAGCARSRPRAGSRDHPPQAPGLDSRRSPPQRSFADALLARHRQRATTSLQRRARPGRGANQAQAPAVDGLAAQRRYERAVRRIASDAYVSCSRNVFEPQRSGGELFRGGRKAGRRGESGSGCEAATMDAVAIAPRPGRARRCRAAAVRESEKRAPHSRVISGQQRLSTASAKLHYALRPARLCARRGCRSPAPACTQRSASC